MRARTMRANLVEGGHIDMTRHERWFRRSAELLGSLGQASEPVAPRDLDWDELIRPVPLLQRIWSALVSIPGTEPKVQVRAKRRVDVDGKPIFLDEHDAPFVLIPDIGQLYVRVFKCQIGRRWVFLTAPDMQPARIYRSAQERARRAVLAAICEAEMSLASQDLDNQWRLERI